MTVTFPLGGGIDILARLIGNALAESMGHAAVVEKCRVHPLSTGRVVTARRSTWPESLSILRQKRTSPTSLMAAAAQR